MKITVPYPSPEEEVTIVKNGGNPLLVPVKKVFSLEAIQKCKNLLTTIHCDDKIIEYIVSIVAVTRPETEKKTGSFRVNSAAASLKKATTFYATSHSGPLPVPVLHCAYAQK